MQSRSDPPATSDAASDAASNTDEAGPHAVVQAAGTTTHELPASNTEPSPMANRCAERVEEHRIWLAKHEQDHDALHDLAGTDLSNCDLTGVDFSRTELCGANLQGAKLTDTTFYDADLRHADLTGATGLLPDRLAGATLAGARLPTDIAFDGLRTAEEMSRNSGRYFVVILTACAYVILTTLTASDVGLFTDSVSATLPIISVPISTVSFYLLTPLVLLAAYIYFHLDLQRLWDTLARLPAVFSDGRTLDERAYPWLLGGLTRSYATRLRAPEYQRSNARPLLIWQKWLSIALAWYAVPATLVVLWSRYIHRNDWTGSAWHVSLILASLLLAWTFRALTIWTLSRDCLHASARVEGSDHRMSQFRRRMGLRFTVAAGIATVVLWGGTLSLLRAIPEAQQIDPKHSVRLAEDDNLPAYEPRKWVPRLLRWVYQPYAELEYASIARSASGTAIADGDCDKVPVAMMENAHLRYALMNGAFLVHADLRYAMLNGAQLTNADLRHADLSGAALIANLESADLRGALLEETDLRGANLDWADLGEADLHGAKLHGASLVGTVLDAATFGGPNPEGTGKAADLSGAILKGASLKGAHLEGANLSGADLSGADLTNVTGLTPEQLQSAIIDPDTKLPPNSMP